MFSFPGRYLTLKLYGCNRRTHLSILAQGLDFVEYIVSKGLWSVHSSNSIPYRYTWKRSHDQTNARASFSVWE